MTDRVSILLEELYKELILWSGKNIKYQSPNTHTFIMNIIKKVELIRESKTKNDY